MMWTISTSFSLAWGVYSPFVVSAYECTQWLTLPVLTRRSSLPRDTIAHLCDAIRTELEHRDLTKYVNTILTAHVVKTPPDYEAGLSLLLRLRGTSSVVYYALYANLSVCLAEYMCTFLGTNAELVEDAVKYIIFLVDADRLFDTALGMYDFSLVLLVAQYSQKVRRHLMQKCPVAYAHQDPREYLPFLRSLRALEGAYQHFKIDDHLKRTRRHYAVCVWQAPNDLRKRRPTSRNMRCMPMHWSCGRKNGRRMRFSVYCV
jgi:elongator complex protein 1